MKNLKAPFLVIALFLNVLLVSAETSSHPPAPGASAARTMTTTAEGECEPIFPDCDDAFPINQNIIFLVVGGLVLGLTVIYKNQIKKASI
jgi:hypothetical protein